MQLPILKVETYHMFLICILIIYRRGSGTLVFSYSTSMGGHVSRVVLSLLSHGMKDILRASPDMNMS